MFFFFFSLFFFFERGKKKNKKTSRSHETDSDKTAFENDVRETFFIHETCLTFANVTVRPVQLIGLFVFI